MKRRAVLAGSVASLGLTAGCFDARGGTVGLSKVTVLNASAERRSPEVTITKEDRERASETLDLRPETTASFECEWMRDPVEYSVRLDTSDGRTQTIGSGDVESDSARPSTRTCADVIFSIKRDKLPVFVRTLDCDTAPGDD